MYRKTGAFSVDATDAVDATETSGFNGARLSATVILIRDTPDGIKVWMQERVMSMKNYPGIDQFFPEVASIVATSHPAPGMTETCGLASRQSLLHEGSASPNTRHMPCCLPLFANCSKKPEHCSPLTTKEPYSATHVLSTTNGSNSSRTRSHLRTCCRPMNSTSAATSSSHLHAG